MFRLLSADRLSLDSIIGADIAAAAVLISMGAVLGRTTPFQLLLMGLIEIFVYAFNEYIQLELFKVCVHNRIDIRRFCTSVRFVVDYRCRRLNCRARVRCVLRAGR